MYKHKNGYFRMPLKRTYSTSTTIVPSGYQATKKRRMPVAKKRKTRALTVGVPRPFPTRMLATLKYTDTIPLQSALVPILSVFYSCNSIYDPYRSGLGHQPYGHDTYATIYNQYTVIRSKCTFQLGQNSAVLNLNSWGGGIADDTATTAAFDTWTERPTYKVERLQNNAGPGAKPMVLYWDRNRRFPDPDTAQSLSANFGSNPAEEEFFELIAQGAASGVSLGTVFMMITIEYVCEMYEPKDLGSS